MTQFTHPAITHPSGELVKFNTQEALDFVLWCRAEVAKSRAMRGKD